MRCTIPTPIRSFNDPITGTLIHQLTEGTEPSAHLYFTRSSWSVDGRYLLFLQQREGSLNFYAAMPDGTVKQLTHYPPTPHPSPFTQHMHRLFRSEEIERLMFRLPAIHPQQPCFAFAWGNDVHLVDIERGTDEIIYSFGLTEAQTPACGLHTVFTADGKDLIFVTTRETDTGERIDAPDQKWHYDLRDESGYISRIWRYDFASRAMQGVLYESNGEQSHLLTCPWDADVLLWVNYLHNCIYTMRRDGSELRRFLTGDEWGQPNHYNWDVANRRLVTNLSDPHNSWRTQLAALDIETGAVHPYRSTLLPHPSHISVSPDGRWVVMDVAGESVGDTQGLHLLDQHADTLQPLCRCSWGAALNDGAGNPVKSEYLHPNPSWSPDGRSIIFATDFGTGIAQIYLADVSDR